MSDLDAARLRRALDGCMIGREIVVLEEATSTNDAIMQMTATTTPQGLVVFAEHQTAGRGRHGSSWESARRQGLWLSILLRPKIDIDKSARLTNWAAETVANTIREQFSLMPSVKQPNDVYVDERKIAGVLVEMRAQTNAPHIAIAGIGINANHAAEDFPEELRPRAISLAMALNRPVDRAEFAVTLLRNLDRTYRTLFGL